MVREGMEARGLRRTAWKMTGLGWGGHGVHFFLSFESSQSSVARAEDDTGGKRRVGPHWWRPGLFERMIRETIGCGPEEWHALCRSLCGYFSEWTE